MNVNKIYSNYFLLIVAVVIGLMLTPSLSFSSELATVLKKVKPAIVGVGINERLARPPNQLQGTGFLVGNGRFAITNYHVVEKALKANGSQQRVIFIGEGDKPEIIEVELLVFDAVHDLAVLKLKDLPEKSFTTLTLENRDWIDDGSDIAFTGFPIGAVLGLYPVTHRGIVSAKTPVAIPASNSGQLSLALIKRLKDPFFTYQLDATAYPGNSGSPVYYQHSGQVVAIINKVLVKQTKESALSTPSGITYAIPVRYLHDLLERAGVTL